MKRKSEIEYRVYQMPAGEQCLALFGSRWFQVYGTGLKELHFHNYMEIGVCYEGNGKMNFGEEVHEFEEGEFTVIPKNYPHVTNSDVGMFCSWEYLFIDVESILKQIYGESNILYTKVCHRINAKAHLLKDSDYPELIGNIRAILNLMREGKEFYQEKVKGLVQTVIFDIACLNRQESEELIVNKEKKQLSWINEIVDYISENYREQIKISELSDRCHMSEVHFRRLFLKHMKMSPVEYINLVRINAACNYMRKTNDSTCEIAQQCGYVTASTFHRNFKKITGSSAREWKKRPEIWERQILKYHVQEKEGWYEEKDND